MQCVACDQTSSDNRAVVDTVSDADLGVLCPECEHEQFGRSLTQGEWTDDCCVLCEGDGFYALPAWRASVVERDGKRIAKSEYSLAGPTPHLCDGHFARLTEESVPEHPDAATPSIHL